MPGARDWRFKPDRPALTPAFVMGFLMWMACAMTLCALRSVEEDSCLAIAQCAGLLSLAALALFAFVKRKRMLSLIVLALCMGVFLAGLEAHDVKTPPVDLEREASSGLEVKLEGDSVKSERGERVFARVGGLGKPCIVLLYLNDVSPLCEGQELVIRGSFEQSDFDQDDYLWSKAVVGTVRVWHVEYANDASPFGFIRGLRKNAVESFGGDNASSALLAAIVCGYRHELADMREYGTFQACGLAHMVAVSGAHLVIVAGLVASVLRAAVGTVRVWHVEYVNDASPFGFIRGLRKNAVESFGGDNASSALLAAIVCGYRHELADMREYGTFQACGLAHMVAVSGAHLVIVAGLVASVLRAARASRRAIAVTTIFVVVAYLVFAGIPVSALRAAIMSILGVSSYFVKRRGSSMNALGVGICLMIASAPQCALSVSFSLSCLSTMGIIAYSPLVGYWIGKTPLARFAFLSDPLSLTLSAALPSQLYAVSVFGVLPLIAPLSNVACAPLFPVVCALGLLAAFANVAQAPFAHGLTDCARFSADALNLLASWLADIPYASIPLSIDALTAFIVTSVALAFFWVCWTGFRARWVAAIVAATLCFSVLTDVDAFNEERITMFDVGQGDAVLVRSRGQSLLIDTGNQDTLLVEALGRNHVRHIDSVLITHADDDHCGSLDVLGRFVELDRVLVADDMLSCEDEACTALVALSGDVAPEVVGLRVGDVFHVGGFTLEVVWPHGFQDDGGNADSLCVLAQYDGDGDGTCDCTALFTGDAECEQVAHMIEENVLGHVDILKVGHHGSKNGLDLEEAEQLGPRIALIGVGENNRYGHPSAETLELLGRVGCTVFRTDEDGDITCDLRADALVVRTMK